MLNTTTCKTYYRIMISRPRLGAVTHIAGCPEREIDITTAGTCPIIFPTTTYKQKPIKMHQRTT
jgi:hypothetical protein